MTIQKKTALIFTAISATILIGISVIAYFFMNTFAFQDFYKRLEIRGIITAKVRLAEHSLGQGELYSNIREQHLEPLPDEKEYFFPADSLRNFVKLNVLPDLNGAFYTKLKERRQANTKHNNYFYTGFYYYDEGAHPYIMIIGAQNEDSIRYSRKLKWILIASCICGTFVFYTSGIFFSRHAFKPIREIIEKVKTIGAENLNQRLEDRKGQDEVAELASTFNEMLSRLETSFETQNNFVSNASHEFRTPLTTIYSEAEIALSRPRESAEYKAALESILYQTEKLQHLTNSLLNLAQTGFDGKKQNLKTIYIDELLFDVKNTIASIVPGNNVLMNLSDLPGDRRTAVNGNYQLLKLGLSNVIENACKYSNNKPVSVKADVIGDRLQLCIIDNGIGIPKEELRFIYDPFFRASNTGRYEGYGIGLPLTRNIFRLHKGEIHVDSDTDKGAVVTLTLPVA